MKRVVVIGSGLGGLAIAIRLQAQGLQVTVLEKNPRVGGHAYLLRDSGYKFDMGPSLITAPEIIRGVFESAGRRMEDYLDLVLLDPFYRIYFHDGSFLDYTGDSERMKTQMRQFNIGDAENYDRFMEVARQIHEAVIVDGLGSTPFMDWRTMGSFIPKALKLKALSPAYSVVKRHFTDPRHRFTFSFHPLFIGGNPFRVPAIYLMIPYLEKTGGVWFAPGGMVTLVEAFLEIFKGLGGTVFTNEEALEILIHGRRAVGVRTASATYDAEIVVSNADVAHTYGDLVSEQHRHRWTNKRLAKSRYAMSAFLLYMGVRRQYPQLLHHTLILSERYRGLVSDIFDNRVLPDDFSMYLHVPTRTDPGMAPEGCESMYVLVPVPNLQGGIDWDEMASPYADRILGFLERDFGLQDLRQHLEVCHTFTPQDFQQHRNSHVGSAWGMEPRLMQTAIFRPHNRSEDVVGLYLVGAGTHPGAGIPGVLLTAEATQKVILEDLG